jgi:DNA-binding LytR/AlgR family response regulator
MNCIAIDDEPLALEVLKEYSRKIDFVNFTGTYTNAIDSIDRIIKTNVDLIFIDIEMPNISGIEFIKSIPNPPLVIFTSAFPQYAINGYELNAVDYLLKPISFDKFLKAVTKASMYLSSPGNNDAGKKRFVDKTTPDSLDKLDEYTFIKVDYSMVKVSFNEMKFIEGLKDYIKIYVNDKILITKCTIKYLEKKLPGDLFVRVHKSYIISLNKIDKIEYNHVFIGSHKIPIGMQHKETFYKKIDLSKL